ncbi:MAG: sulfotransferase family 2 domain-containing protein [Syntrophobacteraceae bacterium]
MEMQKVLIFLHIPKTGGTTLKSILDREYGRNHTVSMGIEISSCIPELAAIRIESRREIQVLRGHFFFGIHELLPSPYQYITILRDPVRRAISHYYHVLGTKWHPLHELVVSRGLSLEDYVTSGVCPQMDNGQTRQLAGVEGIPFGKCSERLLDDAIANMNRHFAFVGLTEAFDESLIQMSDILGWKKRPVYVQRLKNKNKPSLKNISDKTKERIMAQNDLDYRLMDYAKIKFNKNVSPEVIRKTIKFQRINTLYQALKKIIALQNSIHRPIVKKVEEIIKSTLELSSS